MTLHEIGLKYGTDKSTYHGYMDFYEKHFKREAVQRFLEIGVLDGGSLKAWREWFPESTLIEGWDVRQCSPLDGCGIKVVNQKERKEMQENITGLYDIILDDGDHTAKSIQISFSFLFPHTKIYVIEDLHAPWVKKRYLGKKDFNTLEVLKNFSRDGWQSKHSTQEEKDYINKNAKIVDIFIRGDENNPASATCIIENKFYS